MNRLVPLITRAATLRPLPARLTLADASAALQQSSDDGEWLEDFRFFASAWLGAFLFVTTLIS